MNKLTSTPARILLAFAGALLAAMLFAALVAPWVQALLAPLQVFPLHRIFSRLTMLGVVLLTVWLMRREGLLRGSLLGYAGPWPRFRRRLLAGLGAGIALMAIALVPLFLLGVRTFGERAPGDAGSWLVLLLKALVSGILVALIEETFFRGAMQGALQRIGAWRTGLLAVPVLYAAVHFLGRAASVPADEVNALSGFVTLQGFFSSYSHPLAIADAFLALWCVGLLLALVRRHWGDLAACIGLHAGFVAAIAVFRKVSVGVPSSEWSFLVGQFDGLLGIWIAGITALACIALWRRTRWHRL